MRYFVSQFRTENISRRKINKNKETQCQIKINEHDKGTKLINELVKKRNESMS